MQNVKRNSKRFLGILLTLCMVLTLMPITASAAIGDYNSGDIAVIEAISDNNGFYRVLQIFPQANKAGQFGVHRPACLQCLL